MREITVRFYDAGRSEILETTVEIPAGTEFYQVEGPSLPGSGDPSSYFMGVPPEIAQARTREFLATNIRGEDGH